MFKPLKRLQWFPSNAVQSLECCALLCALFLSSIKHIHHFTDFLCFMGPSPSTNCVKVSLKSVSCPLNDHTIREKESFLPPGLTAPARLIKVLRERFAVTVDFC